MKAFASCLSPEILRPLPRLAGLSAWTHVDSEPLIVARRRSSSPAPLGLLREHSQIQEDQPASNREVDMAGIQTLDFNSPDETRTPDKTRVDVVHVGETAAARLTFEPGWKWSECVKPVAGTDSCQLRHVGVVGSGRLVVKHEDGTEVELSSGDAYVIEPGHDAWVAGDEPFVGYEFEARAADAYARE